MNLYKKIFWALFLGLLIFLTLNKHSRRQLFDYHSQIWSDKAGYYIYLPSLFIYHFDPAHFPANIETNTGDGFCLDFENKKVYTKYPCGVAVLQTPFFLTAHCIAIISDLEPNGFSAIYHTAIDLAGVFYLVVGLFFLEKFLSEVIKNKNVIVLTLFLLLFATNLIYYGIDETGMSHVYSFCIFSLLLYFSPLLFKKEKTERKYVIIVGTLIGLIIILRPLNVLYIPFYLLINITSWTSLRERIILLLTKAYIFVPVILVVILPQLLYYYYLTGSPFMYSYTNESFIYKYAPMLPEIWIAPKNGWMLYNPIHFFTIAGMIYMIRNKIANGWYVLLLFLIVSYVCASWWSWELGCAYGYRGFIEFYSLFALPLTYIIKYIIENKSAYIKYTLLSLCLLCTVYNLRFVYSYDGCWYGQIWDWKEYKRIIEK
jgi:hypothetical protein